MKARRLWQLCICALAALSASGARLPRRRIATIFPLAPPPARRDRDRGAVALAVTRELALLRPWDSTVSPRARRRRPATHTAALDEAIAFYAQQHDKILRELLLPALRAAQAARPQDAPEPPKQKDVEWDIVVSTEAEPVSCAVLAEVPPGTVLVRPKPTPDDVAPAEYISLLALNVLARTQPDSLALLFPNATAADLEKLHAHASLPTAIVASLNGNRTLTRAIAALLITATAAATHRLVLDVLLALLRTKAVWHPRVYGLWSRLYHTPAPMLLLTAKRAAEIALDSFASLEGCIRDCSIALEGRMLNADLHDAVRHPKVVRDRAGRARRYVTFFSNTKP